MLLAIAALAFIILLKSGQLLQDRLPGFQGGGESAISPQVPSEHPSLPPPESEDVEEWGAATAPSRVPSPSVSVPASEVVDSLEVPKSGQLSRERLPGFQGEGESALSPQVPSEHPSLRPSESEDVEDGGAATAPSRVPSPSVSVRASEVVDSLEVPKSGQLSRDRLPGFQGEGESAISPQVPSEHPSLRLSDV